jgi:hypothetical protein
VVEVAIESGFAAGATKGGASVPVFNIAGLSVQMRSTNVQTGAFRSNNAFERVLRRFIHDKLSALQGPSWFRQRVAGDMLTKARGGRAAAMANGEQHKELISYLDLGDLANIVFRRDNWGLKGVFPNQDQLQHDLQALVCCSQAHHARPVRLAEVMCIIRRVTQWTEGDAEWKRVADSDD